MYLKLNPSPFIIYIYMYKPLSIINPSLLGGIPLEVESRSAWQTRQSTYLGERSPKRRYGLSIAVQAWTGHNPVVVA